MSGDTVVGNDEAIAFGDVEPFDAAGDLDEIGASSPSRPRRGRGLVLKIHLRSQPTNSPSADPEHSTGAAAAPEILESLHGK